MSTVIEQRIVLLPFLDDAVPALILSDGKIYIPVYKVCQALGIRADMHIRRWQRLVLWITARKLPLQTEKRGRRLVWCLLISEVPFLYGLFDWQFVSPERRLQLLHASEEQAKLANLAYQEMQQQYKSTRQMLYNFLTKFTDIDDLLLQYVDTLSQIPEDETSLALYELVNLGRSLFLRATAHARKMLQDQGMLPIIDVFMIDSNNHAIDSFSMPLLPIVSYEDSQLFFTLIDQITAWKEELRMLWNKMG